MLGPIVLAHGCGSGGDENEDFSYLIAQEDSAQSEKGSIQGDSTLSGPARGAHALTIRESGSPTHKKESSDSDIRNMHTILKESWIKG